MKKALLTIVCLAIVGGVFFGARGKIANFLKPGPPEPWPPDLNPALVYNAHFAQRFGLDPSKAIQLDPGVLAIAMTFSKDYSYRFEPENGDGTDAFSDKNGQDRIPIDERWELDKDAGILPILFPGKYNPMTLVQSYKGSRICALNLYLDSNNAQVQQIDFRPFSIFISKQVLSIFDELFFYAYDNQRQKIVTVASLHMADWHIALQSFGDFKDIKGDTSDTLSHFVDFLPGITFVSFDAPCYVADYYPQGALVWFEKKGAANYFDLKQASSEEYLEPDLADQIANLKLNPDDFIKFHIPSQITNSSQAQAVKESVDHM